MSMIKICCPHCEAETEAPEAYEGRKARCQSCGETLIIEFTRESSVPTLPTPISAQTRVNRGTPSDLTNKATQFDPRSYKVLSQKDKWFSGKFDPEQLEIALNSYAQQGWVLNAAVTASIAGFGGNREELVMILER